MADNRFTGKARALQRMRQIPSVVRSAARGQLDIEGQGMVDAIRPNVPVDEGDLADSVEWHRSRRMDRIAVVVTEGANDETQGRKARANEFGRPDMPARPHFFPTYRARRKGIKARVNRAIRNAVKRLWGKS